MGRHDPPSEHGRGELDHRLALISAGRRNRTQPPDPQRPYGRAATPLPQIVARLNERQPLVLVGYASDQSENGTPLLWGHRVVPASIFDGN